MLMNCVSELLPQGKPHSAYPQQVHGPGLQEAVSTFPARPPPSSRSFQVSRQLGGVTVCPQLLPHTPGSEAHNCIIDSGTVETCGAEGPPACTLFGDREHAATRRVTGIHEKDWLVSLVCG